MTLAADHLRSLLHEANQRLAKKDHTIWGPSAVDVAKVRMGWIDLPEKSRELLPALDALAARMRAAGKTRVVLSGMGGSSLAPEVIATVEGKTLNLLDSTHPDDVHRTLDPDPTNSVFIISSKSGETIETLSHLKAIEERLADAELSLREHLIIISDQQSPLIEWAHQRGLLSYQGNPEVGGRFSALSIFGLLPSALLGIDCANILDDAQTMQSRLNNVESASLAIELAIEILGNQPFLRLKPGPMSNWIEQLVAESTGKDGKGIIPTISQLNNDAISQQSTILREVQALPLGAAFYLWEWTTALLAVALEVNPFDQPNVASAKNASQQALSERATISATAIRKSSEVLTEIEKLRAACETENEYLGILAYTSMSDKASRNALLTMRDSVEVILQRPVTLGFGPRYLHSTGQCHKGGPALGTFLILTVELTQDYPIAGADYTFGELLIAQAIGDVRALQAAGRKVIHAHLSWNELESLSRALHEAS